MSLNVTALLDALAASQGDKLVREGVASWLGGAAAPKVVKAKSKKAVDDVSSGAEDKPKAKPKAKSKAAGSESGASTASREPSQAMLEHRQRTTAISALYQTVKKQAKERDLDLDNLPKYPHMRVTSYLKDNGTIDEVIGASDLDAVQAALEFLAENPDWQPAAKAKTKGKAKGPKGAGAGSDSEAEEKPKAKKPAAKKAVPPLPLSDSEDEGAGDDLPRIPLFGQEFYHDPETDQLYDVEENGSRGRCVGTWDGKNATFSSTYNPFN